MDSYVSVLEELIEEYERIFSGEVSSLEKAKKLSEACKQYVDRYHKGYFTYTYNAARRYILSNRDDSIIIESFASRRFSNAIAHLAAIWMDMIFNGF